jgi:putative ABC transport system permease protein
LINVLGLAAGLAASLLIGLFVRHEISYDQYYANAERIYRVSRDIQPPGEDTVRVSANSGPAAALLLQDFPQIEQVARLNTATNLLLSRDETAFYQNQLRFVDAAFFGLFEFEWLQGNPATALTEPASVVLTASLAAQYFGDINPVGMTLTLDNRLPLQVTGVIADLPQNTHLHASGFASIEALNTLYRPGYLDNWFSINTHTYILLEPGVGIAEIESGLAAFNERYVPQGVFSSAMRITALKDIHWARDMSGPLKPAGNFATIVIFSATGICILIIACINFINLSTAKFSQRALEVGVRKSIGASRSQLIRQFLGESLCLTVLAMLIALVLAELMVPMVSSFIGQELAFNYLATPLIFTSLIGATLLSA